MSTRGNPHSVCYTGKAICSNICVGPKQTSLHMSKKSRACHGHISHLVNRSWVNISEGHIVDLQAHGHRIFLKAQNVTEYPDFDGHLHVDSGNSPPNLHYKLKHERQELRKREKMIRKGKAKRDVVEVSSCSEEDDNLKRPEKRHCPPSSRRIP